MTFVFDLETDLIQHGMLAPKPVCIAMVFDVPAMPGMPAKLELTDDVEWGLWAAFHEKPVVGHNVAFDMACLCAHYPHLIPGIFQAYENGRVEDTLIRQKLIDLRTTGRLADSYSLKAVAERYGLEVDKDGGWRTGYSALRGIPVNQWPAGAREYALNDVYTTAEIYKRQGDVSSAEHTPADFALYLASCWGVRTSKPRVESLLKVLDEATESAKRRLQRAGLVRKDGTRDTKKAKAYMQRRMSNPKLTDKGGISLDADACALSGSRLLELYARFVSANGTRTKAEDLTHGYDLPLQTRYTSIVETSRTSASKPRPPVYGWQAQNPPNPSKKKGGEFRAGFRECLEPDGVFIIADYPSAELYSVSEVCFRQFGYSALRDLLLADRDVHCALAALTLGKTYEEVYAGRKGPYKRDRDRGKPINYGLWGGLGKDTFKLFSRAQYGLIFTDEEFMTWRETWRRMLPETVEYFAWINRLLGGGKSATITHPITGFTRAGCSYTSGANFMFQNLTATAAKAALWEVTRRCYSVKSSALYGYRTPLFVHDEIVAEGPENTAHEAAIELAQVMQDVYNRYTPNVPLKVEACVSRFWSKSAEPVWANGRLVPWEGK
jgi:DNA polymerase-1